MPEYIATHQPCNACGSSDGKSYFKDGGSKCHVCGKSQQKDGIEDVAMPVKQVNKKKKTCEDVVDYPAADMTSRGISKEAATFYGVKQSHDLTTGEPLAWYFPYHKDGKTIAYKVRRIRDKAFFSVGDMGGRVDLFGADVVGNGGKLLIITEGECDTLAVRTILAKIGKAYKCVSVPNGAQAAAAAIGKNLKWLEGFDKVIINFDKDEAGEEAAKEVAEALNIGQAYIMTMPKGYKDANQLLEDNPAQCAKLYLNAIYNAKEHRPDELVIGRDTWEMYNNRPVVVSYAFPESWTGINAMTYGIRLSELDSFTSGTGAGKTQFMREIMHHFVTGKGLKIGIMSLEEPIIETIESYIGLGCNKRIHLPDVESTEEEKIESWGKMFGGNNVVLYDAFGGEERSVIQNIRYMAKGDGCQLILLDHLHMLLDGKDSEKDQIERVMLTLKKLTQELKIWIGLVVHVKKSTGAGCTFEEGAIATLDDMKGSSAIKQLSNTVYVLGRDQTHDDCITRNTSEIYVRKCRFTGRTGYAMSMLFDQDTGRMNVVDREEL